MASSGSFTTTEYEGRSLTFSWSIQSQSIANNTTTISWNLKGSGSYTYGWVTCGGFKVVINGSTVYSQSTDYRVNVYSGTTVASGTHIISHNSDGSKTFSASAQAGIYTYAVNCSGSGSWALTTIPRASSFGTISGNTIGGNMTVNITRNSSSFTHQLWYKLGNSQWYDLGTGIGISKTFTISNDLLSQLPSATNGILQLCVRTYNGSTQIGSDVYKNVTVYVNNNVVPKVGTITLTPQTYSQLIQGKNKVTVGVSGCSAGTGSSIKSYTFSGPGLSTTTTSTSATSGIISSTGALTYTVTVTDNRGRTVSGTKTITCYPYSAPYIKSFSVYRSDANGTKTDKGKYIACILNNSIVYSSVGNTNNVTVRLYYRNNAGVSGFNYETLMTNSTDISVNKKIPIGNGTYSAYLEITDRYGGKSITSTETIFGELRVLNITQDGTGIAFGKMSEKTDSNSNGLFECKWDAKFYGTATGPSGFSTSSDERVKKNIKDIDVNIVDGLRPVQYELSSVDDGKVHYGFVAQEVASLLDSVGLDSETTGMVGYIINNGQQEYVLTYTEFVPLLTKKCQDLQSEIDMLKQEIDELKNNIVK